MIFGWEGCSTETSAVKLRVVIVEDDPIARHALAEYLRAGRIEIVSSAGSAADGLQAVRETVPDVALVDLGLPDYSGIELTRQIAKNVPVTKVLVVTGSEARHDLVDSLRAGATGYLVKSASPAEIRSATAAAGRGEAIITDEIARELFDEVIEAGKPAAMEDEAVTPALSAREQEILRLLAAGKGNAEIASELFLSPYTVKNHVANILAKLHLQNRIQAAVHAVRSGIAD